MSYPELTNKAKPESKESLSDSTILFRGSRNSAANEDGTWWTEDAFYACSISGPTGDVFMMVVPKSLLAEYRTQGKAVDQTYRDHNTNESEIEFPNGFPAQPVKLSDKEKSSFLKLLKFTSIGTTLAVKRLFSGSGVKKTREVVYESLRQLS